MTRDATIAVPEGVLSRKAAGETVLLSLATEEYYGLDGVGSRFWDLIGPGTTFGQLVETLLEEFDVERETLEADLSVLLDDLVDHRLVLIDAP